jgi:hypothetical protein
MALILMFPALRTLEINLRELSAFFSRETKRFKTTLCKLYQITLILGALDIMERTAQPCEVTLKAPFTRIILDEDPAQGEEAFAIENLLFRPNLSHEDVAKRREEFQRSYGGKTRAGKP